MRCQSYARKLVSMITTYFFIFTKLHPTKKKGCNPRASFRWTIGITAKTTSYSYYLY